MFRVVNKTVNKKYVPSNLHNYSDQHRYPYKSHQRTCEINMSSPASKISVMENTVNPSKADNFTTTGSTEKALHLEDDSLDLPVIISWGEPQQQILRDRKCL